MFGFKYRSISFALPFVLALVTGSLGASGVASADYKKRHFTPEVSIDEYSHHTSKKKKSKRSYAKKKSLPQSSAKSRINTSYEIYVKVDISQQRMYVYRNGSLKHTWKVSTGTKSYPTPKGKYGVNRMYPMFYATNWNRAEMPHSIFFKGGYAIHGTKSVSKLGRPASHGCVRLHRSNAKKLYYMVQKVDRDDFQIDIRS